MEASHGGTEKRGEVGGAEGDSETQINKALVKVKGEGEERARRCRQGDRG